MKVELFKKETFTGEDFYYIKIDNEEIAGSNTYSYSDARKMFEYIINYGTIKDQIFLLDFVEIAVSLDEEILKQQ
jgi:hypothetical protein